MVRKLNTGEVYKYYIGGFDNIIHSKCGKGCDIWVDENNFEHNENVLPSYIEYHNKKKNFPYRGMFRKNGKLHNLFGPAIIFYDGDNKSYWIDGKRYDNKKDWEIEVNRIKMIEEINN